MVVEVLSLEGYHVDRVRTASEAFSILNQHSGRTVVIMDNLHACAEGQRFLDMLSGETAVRACTKVLSMAAGVIGERIHAQYGDLIDADLAMPFTADQLMNAIEVLGLEGQASLVADGQGVRPRVLVLAYELSVSRTIADILDIEGHEVEMVRTAAEVETILASRDGRYIVIMPYPHNNSEALALVSQLREQPEVRARVKFVGLSAVASDHRATITSRCDLDEHVAMPYNVDEFVAAVRCLWREPGAYMHRS